MAQVNETRARVFIAQEQYGHAEDLARAAVRTLEKGGRQSLLAEALTTHGVALARLGYQQRARLTLFRAAEIAHVSGALNTAGLAALALIEELSEYLTADELQAVYQRAYDWLLASQHTHRLLNDSGIDRDTKESQLWTSSVSIWVKSPVKSAS